MKVYRFKEVKRILENNGYYILRKSGHYIFTNAEGDILPVPNKDILSPVLVMGIFKRHNIKEGVKNGNKK